MKKFSLFMLVCLILSGCSDVPEVTTEKTTSTVEESPKEEPVEENTEESEPIEEAPVEEEELVEEAEEPVVSESDIESEEYISQITDLTTQFSDVMFTFSDLNAQAGADPYLITTDDWVIEAAVSISEMGDLIEKIRNLSPPSNLQASHDLLLLGMDEYQFVVDNYPTAIDTLDVDLINRCSDAMARGTTYIDDARLAIPSY